MHLGMKKAALHEINFGARPGVFATRLDLGRVDIVFPFRCSVPNNLFIKNEKSHDCCNFDWKRKAVLRQINFGARPGVFAITDG
jgi:hypothetical protein